MSHSQLFLLDITLYLFFPFFSLLDIASNLCFVISLFCSLWKENLLMYLQLKTSLLSEVRSEIDDSQNLRMLQLQLQARENEVRRLKMELLLQSVNSGATRRKQMLESDVWHKDDAGQLWTVVLFCGVVKPTSTQIYASKFKSKGGECERVPSAFFYTIAQKPFSYQTLQKTLKSFSDRIRNLKSCMSLDITFSDDLATFD